MSGQELDETPDARAARRTKRTNQMRQSYRDGGLDVLEQFVPGILAAMARAEELLPKVYDLVEKCIDSGDTSALKDIAPLVKLLVDENKRLLDRRFGSSVQRAQVEHSGTVTHTNLRTLMAERKALRESPPPPPTDDIVVEAEVIRDADPI